MASTDEGPTIMSYAAHRRDFVAGVRAMVPWLMGVAPFGLVIGVSAAQAGIPTVAGWLTGPAIYAGSAQIATIQMLDAGVAPFADRKSTRLNSSHLTQSRMPSSA